MKVFEANIKDIKPYDKNPRVIPQEAVEKVANSIREFGFQQPIVVDKDMVVIVGHTRLKAAESLRMGTVPCVIADNLSEEQVRAYRLADNKTNEYTSLDMELLDFELGTIADINMEDFGFSFDMDEKEPEEDDFDTDAAVEDARKNCYVHEGDLFALGSHRLLCGDSTKESDVSLLMDGLEADCVITDPPYNVAYEGGTKEHMTIKNDNMGDSQFRQFLENAFKNASNVMKAGAAFYIWYADVESYNFFGACASELGCVRQVLIWKKSSLILGRKDYQFIHEPCLYGWKEGASHRWFSDRSQTTVMEFDKPTKSDIHPTMKPIPLFAYQMQNSTEKGNVVLDLFGGSGTTLMAAEQIGRRCRMMEYDPVYCQAIIDRWETYTGKKAEKLN